MKAWIIGFLILLLGACSQRAAHDQSSIETGAAAQPAPPLEDFGPAPEFTNEVWLNTPTPLRLAGLRGSVVAVDMWTFG